MPTMGYCHDCGAWLQLYDDLSCPNGHPAARVNGWYDPATGQQLTGVAPSASPVSTAEPTRVSRTAPSRDAFLADLMATVASNPAFSATWGTDTDMTIASNPIDGSWGAGHKRVEYTAVLKAVEADSTVYFWEMLEERTSGLSFGTFESETYSTAGMKRSGTRHEATVGPGSASWEWGYGTLRNLVEDVAARHGFAVRVVLAKHSACW
ncbi:MAG TPA: hypothetical protein VIK83_02415 [Coriobacteriia bacterium]